MTALEAWTAVVEGEDAAVYAYSVAGAQVSGGGRRKALAGLEAHRANRSRAASTVAGLGGTPPPAAAAYDLPEGIEDPTVARSTMAGVDNALVATYADAAAASDGGDRRWAARTASECAVRAVVWGAEPQAFPAATPVP